MPTRSDWTFHYNFESLQVAATEAVEAASANEPLYCICRKPAYGDMVGCDNDDCPVEWYHLGCMGLKEAPKGTWYCPTCRPTKGAASKKVRK